MAAIHLISSLRQVQELAGFLNCHGQALVKGGFFLRNSCGSTVGILRLDLHNINSIIIKINDINIIQIIIRS